VKLDPTESSKAFRVAIVVDDDVTLVRRALRGDDFAIAAIVSRYQDMVFSVCLRLLAHRHDAEDVCQEVFVRVFRSLHRWDAARSFRPWLLGIAVNRCRTWISKRARRPELADYLQDTAEARPADDSLELAREVAAALDQLRPEYREAFVLFHEQGLAYDAIAEALDRPVGTVKTWLHRARLELWDTLRARGMVDADALTQSSTKSEGR
jgi:RNA polymerase sigma-70 factor (ECF subfamily)